MVLLAANSLRPSSTQTCIHKINYRIGCISSGVISNMLGVIMTLTIDDAIIPLSANGTPHTLAFIFCDFFSFL